MEITNKFAQILGELPLELQTKIYLLACSERKFLAEHHVPSEQDDFDYWFWDQLRAAYEEVTNK
jgi:hypothetical protein